MQSSIGGVGFLQDVRRMNVALTRARHSLWVVSNCKALIQSPPWKALIEYTCSFIHSSVTHFCLALCR
jgi:superfamily I DNA and/or RNA helicase